MDSADALMEERKLMMEAKYRNYMANIDKALRNFEYSSEWADLISALGKLSKAISSNTQYQVIPRRLKISKRLAQCMHPALPSGVHLKALETYDVIFSKMGSERLATELFIYSSGLFPLLGYAAMNVRPTLLGIYETYFVPLGERLRPALSGFLSGVLPGYECGLDHFERTSSLLSQVCAAVNPTHFYTVLWECMATNASIRLPAITYLLEHFNKRLGMQEQIYIMGHNRDIMMSGLCACLNDTVILVQRNTLEFLLLGFPMHTIYLREIDLIQLLTNGLNAILRRDMSLNRRLYSWLLGTEISKNSPTYDTVSIDGGQPEETESYFEKHSKHIVIQSLIATLKLSLECTVVDLKPYRIMMSLLDKAEIGSAVLDYVLCDIVRTMSLSSGNVEVIKSANLLFATFDPAYIWSFKTSMYEKSCKKQQKITSKLARDMARNGADGKYRCVVGSGDPCLIEICYLTEFLLETISLEMYNETTRIYLPKVFLAITQMLTLHLDNISSEEVTASLKLCMKIVSRVQPMITSPIKLVPRTNHGYASSDERGGGGKGVLRNSAIAVNYQNATAVGLEKSKSDSKLNQSAHNTNSGDGKDAFNGNGVPIDESIRRSASNQHMERRSPQKKKRAKSASKLSELDKEICPDTGEIIEPQPSSSDLDTPLSIKKLKVKTKPSYMRIRSSPKKLRPKDIPVASNEPKSLDPALLKSPSDNTDDAARSAPAEQLQKEHVDEFIFDYQDTPSSSEEEFSILEKCIRQYEVFYEIYLSRKLLQIKTPNTLFGNEICGIRVKIERDGDVPLMNMKSVFDNEQVFEDENPDRLLEIDKLFQTLCVNVVSRSKQLRNLLQSTLGTHNMPDGGVGRAGLNANDQPSTVASDVSDNEYRDCFSSAEQFSTEEHGKAAHNNKTPSPASDEKTEKSILALIELRLSSSLRTAIKLASNLLVEMSTFPNCNKNIMLGRTERELPSWLKVLCLVATCMQNDKELQLSAITTLFDLISLLKSQIEHTTSPGVTFVVMLPLLKFGHVAYIEQRTRIFHLITSILWDYLGEPNVDAAQITALLYQLHNCLESGLVETIIGNRMYSRALHQQFAAADLLTDGAQYAAQRHQPALQRYHHDRAGDIQLLCLSPVQPAASETIAALRESEARSFKKFELLWHLGRDKQSSKGFEKTLLKVLDTLALPHYMAVHTFVTKWLQAALLRGDLPRLVKPLYKMLLAPQTKRIGIVHLHLLHREGEPDGGVAVAIAGDGVGGAEHADSALESSVYAISSEYGNIKYHHHVKHHAGHKKRSPIHNFHKKIFGVTLSSKNKTSNFVSDKLMPMPLPSSVRPDTPPPLLSEDAASIGLIVNPLDNSPDFDDENDASLVEGQQPAKCGGDGRSVSKLGEDAADDLDEEDDDEEDDDGDGDGDGGGDGHVDALIAAGPHDYEQDYTDESDSSSSNNSIFDSESENRETSVEKDDSLTLSSGAGAIGGASATAAGALGGGGVGYAAGSLKRFAGDCERVTEKLSQHERTKNRKTYRLTREKTPGDSSLASNNTTTTDEQASLAGSVAQQSAATATGEEDTAHAADEYFSSSGAFSVSPRLNVRSHNNASAYDAEQQQPMGATEQRSLSPTKYAANVQGKKKQRRSHSANAKQKIKSKKHGELTGSDKKRMSCISKTSTDSNNSYSGAAQSQRDSAAATPLSDEDTASTINVEDKRRQLSLETSRSAAATAAVTSTSAAARSSHGDWELTDEALEKGKQNSQILRESAAAAAAASAAAASKTTHNSNNAPHHAIHTSSGGEKRTATSSSTSTAAANRSSSSILQLERLRFYHHHMLIYQGVYDTRQTLYAFQTLRHIIASDTRTFLCLAITTSLSSSTLKQLLIRHRKCISGRGFGGSVTNSEFAQNYRGCMQLEVLVTICLHYARGFYYRRVAAADVGVAGSDASGTMEGTKDATAASAASASASTSTAANEQPQVEDIIGNCRVQLESIELLTLICTELIDIVKGMGKGLACYIADLMSRCKLQKVILHCLNASVAATALAELRGVQLRRQHQSAALLHGEPLLAERVLRFNDPQDEQLHAEAFQVQLLRLLMAVIKLEHEVMLLKADGTTTTAAAAAANNNIDLSGNISPTRLSALTPESGGSGGGGGNGAAGGSANANGTAAATNVKYLPLCQISQQPMFLAAVLSALQDDRLRHLHRNWTHLVTSSLKCFVAGSLTNIVISVVHQLCSNVDRIARDAAATATQQLPPDYVVSQLEAITVLCHYCLLDSAQQTTLSQLFSQASYPQTSVVAAQSVHGGGGGASGGGGGQLLNNIVHTFLSTAAAAAAVTGGGSGGMGASSTALGAPGDANAARLPSLQAARNAVLSHLSRIVACVAGVWDSELGQLRPVKQQLMEFLSPVSLHHGANFLAAVAVTWQERGDAARRGQKRALGVTEQYQRNSTLQAAPEQLSLVTLVSSIRVMPMDSFVQTLHQVVKAPPPIHRPPKQLAIEVSALELFYFYMRSAPAPQLGDSWSALLALLRDGLALCAPAQFALLMLLHEFVQRCPQLPFPDKKDVRDLHDITSRLVDSLSAIAGSCLEQTTWLRRNLAVREDVADSSSASSVLGGGNGFGAGGGFNGDGVSTAGSDVSGGVSESGGGGLGGNQQYSVQAQSVLAAVLANLLDVAYGSQEKDKVVTIVTTLLYNITPYLKNHTPRNVPSFYACSSLLASISSYQYTRKAWRKDMLDLLLDTAFFQMDVACLPFWKQIMDNLMTSDNTTFRELMSRVSLTPSGSLNIFTSREQECEQRAMLLKRLAFVIFCSEFDQYCKYMPEIQEQLANSLRTTSVMPSVQAAVFLCFRVLLLRMSPDHVTSLWPTIIAEMVQVFLAMEHELKSDDLNQEMRMISGMDGVPSNGLISQTHLLHWRSVQLEAVKLLELGCVLPATNLPHFQMYRWAFVGTEFDVHEEVPVTISNGNIDGLGADEQVTASLSPTLYVPHVRRIARLMDMKYTVHSPVGNFRRGRHLVLTCQQINSLQDLYGFFSTLSVTCPNPRNYADTDKEVASCLEEIEEILAKDFLESMPSSGSTPR